MARFSANQGEAQHLTRINQQMPIGGIVNIKLKNGTTVEGVLRNVSVGNTGGKGGWHYRGECTIEDKNGNISTIDYLDIQSASAAMNKATIDEYVRLGKITILP